MWPTVFSIFTLFVQTQASWYYDQASCSSMLLSSMLCIIPSYLQSTGHTQVLQTDGMPNAISLIQGAANAIGASPSNGTAWSFPNTDARDLAGRIFGSLSQPLGFEGYLAIKSMLSNDTLLEILNFVIRRI